MIWVIGGLIVGGLIVLAGIWWIVGTQGSGGLWTRPTDSSEAVGYRIRRRRKNK